MWKTFARIAFEYVEDFLLKKITSVQHFRDTFEFFVFMGGQAVDAVTDNDPNNKAQLQAIWEKNFVNLLSIVLRGVYDVVKNPQVKERVVAILRKTLNDIETPPAA